MRAVIVLAALVATPLMVANAQQQPNPGRGHDAAHCAKRIEKAKDGREINKCPVPAPQPPPPADTQPTPQPPPADTQPTPPPPTSGCPVAAPAVGGTGSIDGSVYQDGTWQLLAGWCINLSGPVSGVALTDGSGRYSFTGLPDGTYTVCEVQQAGWLQTFPTNTAPCQGGWGWSFFVSGGRASFNDFVNRRL